MDLGIKSRRSLSNVRHHANQYMAIPNSGPCPSYYQLTSGCSYRGLSVGSDGRPFVTGMLTSDWSVFGEHNISKSNNSESDIFVARFAIDMDYDRWHDFEEEACDSDPLNPLSVPIDQDGDGSCDALDGDLDGDGVPNEVDSFPSDPCSILDTDGDGLPDYIYPDCTTSYQEDEDDDNDSIGDQYDLCTPGLMDWTSNSSSDYDSDGCQDSIEDDDDDNDGVNDVSDSCNPPGLTGWTSNNTTDYDSDGCNDQTQDFDDDNDGQQDNPWDDCILEI